MELAGFPDVISCWFWGSKYSAHHVACLFAGIRRNYRRPFRAVCIAKTDRRTRNVIRQLAKCEVWNAPDPELLRPDHYCYARLRMFDPAWQRANGIATVCNFDLDLVVTDRIESVLGRGESFLILHRTHFNPCRFNGSMFKIRAGAHPEVWTEWNYPEAWRVANLGGQYRGSDQTWIAHKLPDAAGWSAADGVYGFKKPGWPGGLGLPDGARIVAFPGTRDPSRLRHIDWVGKHWRL